MRTGNIDDINAPRAMKNIVQEVMDYIEQHWVSTNAQTHAYPTQFGIYEDALAAVWPELHKASKEAHVRVAISIYAEIAERWGFKIPQEVKDMVL